MKQYLVFIITFLTIMALDVFWIGFIAKSFYKNQLGSLLKMSGENMAANIPAALGVWALIALGIVVFILSHPLPFLGQIKLAAILGLVMYGVYDLTNYALLAHWPFLVVVVDIVWGILLHVITVSIVAKLMSLIHN